MFKSIFCKISKAEVEPFFAEGKNLGISFICFSDKFPFHLINFPFHHNK